jgi:hypothetical protein
MSGRDLKDAAEKMAKRKEIMKKQVPMLPDAPENIRLSKAEFIAKRRHEKEEGIAVENFKKEFRAKKIAEDTKEVNHGVQEEIEEVKEVKKARKKKVE